MSLLECWHHELSRQNAVRLLQSRGLQNGMFLCRSGQGGNAPVISLVAREDVQHFVVQSSPQHLCLRLDGGQWFVGLDELIRHYSHSADGLPCPLSEPCPGDPLPADLLASGPDTVLHAATRNQDIHAVHDICMSDMNLVKYRDRAGRTCLHLAVLSGNNQLVDLLLKMKSDSRLRDCDGCSPVHLAARNNNVEAVIILFKYGAELTARVHSTGWSPLHEAAYAGNYEVTEKLLELGVPVHPRCNRGRTPAELARTRSHHPVTEMIEGWTKKINTRVRQAIPLQRFLHGTIDRNHASDLCLRNGEGSFLVRESRRREGDLVLTVNFNQHVFNYEVRNG
jgi:tyrosine-protein kinase